MSGFHHATVQRSVSPYCWSQAYLPTLRTLNEIGNTRGMRPQPVVSSPELPCPEVVMVINSVASAGKTQAASLTIQVLVLRRLRYKNNDCNMDGFKIILGIGHGPRRVPQPLPSAMRYERQFPLAKSKD